VFLSVDARPGSSSTSPGLLGDYAGCIGAVLHAEGGSTYYPIRYGGVLITTKSYQASSKTPRGDIKLSDIKDGTTKTFLIGEKYVPASKFGDIGYDASIYNGDTTHQCMRAAGTGTEYDDNCKPVMGLGQFNPPAGSLEDQSLTFGADYRVFGGSHLGSIAFVFCDGSVRMVGTSIETDVYSNLANRADGKVIMGDTW
jgi:hypothetical protein